MIVDMITFTEKTSINELPEFVLVYILSLVAPYNDLKNCMIVDKYWCTLVREVIRRRKLNFVNAIKNRAVCWEQLHVGTEQGPTISRRYAHSACIHKDSLYIFGGCTYRYTTFNDLWKFDLNSREWIRPLTTGTYPSPKACSSMVSFKDEIWLFGGWTHPSPYPYHQGLKIYKELHSYNSVTNKWTVHMTSMEPPSSAAHSATLQNNRYMVVFGGLQFTGVGHQYQSSNSVWVFDLEKLDWEFKITNTLAPHPRYGHSQISIDERRMLILGGCGGPNMQRNDMWLLTMPECETDLWMWQEIQVKNSPNRATIQWSSPAVKVESTVVMLSSDNAVSSSHYQLPHKRVICQRRSSESNNNIQSNLNQESRDLSQANDELNVNGRKGTFKRRHSQCRSVAGSSSDEGDANSIPVRPQRFPPSRIRLSYGDPSHLNLNEHNVGLEHENRAYPSLRMNASNDRQRQLEILRRYEDRIRASPPQPGARVSGIYVPQEMEHHSHNHRRLQVHSLDLSELQSSNQVTWFPKPTSLSMNDGPEEVIRYSLTAGNSEIVLFGGVYKDTEVEIQSPQLNDIVSNSLHFISAPQYII